MYKDDMKEKVKRYVEECQGGNNTNLAELIDMQLQYSHRHISRYAKMTSLIDDITQEARIEIINSLKKYDSSYGASFLTYTDRRVLGRIQAVYRRIRYQINGSVSTNNKRRFMAAMFDKLSQHSGATEIEELGKECGLDAYDALVVFNSVWGKERPYLSEKNVRDFEVHGGIENIDPEMLYMTLEEPNVQKKPNSLQYGTYTFKSPKGCEYSVFYKDLSAFSEAHKLHKQTVSKVARGLVKNHRGWTCVGFKEGE